MTQPDDPGIFPGEQMRPIDTAPAERLALIVIGIVIGVCLAVVF